MTFISREPASPNTTRSGVVLEIAAGLVGAEDQPYRQAKVMLKESGSEEWPLCLMSSSATDAIAAVVSREIALATINPVAALSVAYHGGAPYSEPQPVRSLSIIPSRDRVMLAVTRATGLRSVEEIAERRFPLKIGLRGNLDHAMHGMFRDVVSAAGCSMEDITNWGGAALPQGGLPRAGDRKFELVRDGTLNAIFDEGYGGWIDAVLDADMTILSFGETTLQKLETLGYRRAVIDRARHPRLADDVVTLDFSGWAIFVHADLPDQLVTQMCTALNERKELIAWEGEGALPVERMCRDGEDTPMDVPLHPAAQRYWQECGYL